LILFLPVFGLPLFWLLPFATALPLYLFILGISILLYFKIFQAMRQEVKTGQEAMLGKKGLVVENIDPEGKIQFTSEIWDAVTKGKRFLKGEQVRISGFQGLRLLVEEIPIEKDMMGKGRCHT
jgi:membrane-bound ClpP family serine protease